MSDDLFADLDPLGPAISQWERTQALGDREVPFGLERGERSPSREELHAVAVFWHELASFDERARTFLLEDTLEDESATGAYVEHHLEGLRFEVLTELFGDADDLEIGTFLQALRLLHVTLLPSERAAVFDYSLGRAITDAVLSVSVSADGERWAVDIATYVDEGGRGA